MQAEDHRREATLEVDSSRGNEEIEKPEVEAQGDRERSLPAVNISAGDEEAGAPVKRRRGRPLGSKNRPKPLSPPPLPSPPPPAAKLFHVIEIPAGHDVIAYLALLAGHRYVGISVLSATGAVENVAFRQPPFLESSAVAPAFRGPFEILSISATFFPAAMDAVSPNISGATSVFLAGPPGKVLGGRVAGPLTAASTVVIVAAVFLGVDFHRLRVEDDNISGEAKHSSEDVHAAPTSMVP